MSEKSNGAGRTRNYATVVYPESAPNGWQDILSEHHVPAFISPLHDKDIDPLGQAKKPHYHVMVMFEGVKSKDQATALFDTIGGVGCEIINSVRGYARYLCHLDNPEKAQYDNTKVRQLGGADFNQVITLVSDKYKAISEIIEYCKNEDIDSFADLLEYAAVYREDWFRVLCDNGTVVVSSYLKARTWRTERARARAYKFSQYEEE